MGGRMAELEADIQDALTEVMNMAAGNAAGTLSSMVGEEVHLEVPRLELGTMADFDARLHSRETDELIAVRESFKGSFSGHAYLIFPEQQSLSIVTAILGGETPLESVSEVAREALMEIGNIILNGALSTVCNLLGYEIDASLPAFEYWHEVKRRSKGEEIGVFVHIDFKVLRAGACGYLVIFMSNDSLDTLVEGIRKLMMRESY